MQYITRNKLKLYLPAPLLSTADVVKPKKISLKTLHNLITSSILINRRVGLRYIITCFHLLVVIPLIPIRSPWSENLQFIELRIPLRRVIMIESVIRNKVTNAARTRIGLQVYFCSDPPSVLHINTTKHGWQGRRKDARDLARHCPPI